MKNILVFGASGSIGQEFVDSCAKSSEYKVVTAGRGAENDIRVDFSNAEDFLNLKAGDIKYDAVIFLQGINPTKNLEDSNPEHFVQMFNLNIIGPAFVFRQLSKKLNPNASVVMMNSIASYKGSYDPAYAASKSAIKGLIHSLANAYPQFRFNSISLGLVKDSRVYNQMTPDFREKHALRMYNNSFVQVDNVIRVITELIENENINKAEIPLNGGYL